MDIISYCQVYGVRVYAPVYQGHFKLPRTFGGGGLPKTCKIAKDISGPSDLQVKIVSLPLFIVNDYSGG